MQRIGRKKKKGSWNFRPCKFKEVGCKVCEHNPMGVCEVESREVAYAHILHNTRPPWCPLGKGKKK